MTAAHAQVPIAPRGYTARISKGGALIGETTALLREWEPCLSVADLYARVVEGNALGKATRSRARDILGRVFVPRFLAPGQPAATALKALVQGGAEQVVVQRLVLYHAALADHLLYDCVAGELYRLHEDGHYGVTIEDMLAFLRGLISAGRITPPWSASMVTRTAQGLLATCRDTGLLQGAVRKSFAPVYLPFEAFAYVAYALKDRGLAGASVVDHRDWRLFLLSRDDVERLFVEAEGRRLLRYQAAGDIRRIDWTYATLEEAMHGLGY